jgi:nicotinamidase-related amidase
MPDNAVFAFVDHQTALMNLVENVKAVEYKNDVLGLAELATLHRMPVVLTTSAEDGPNGPKLPEILALLPDAPLVSRPGQINAWDNADFVQAIERTGRRKIIMSGLCVGSRPTCASHSRRSRPSTPAKRLFQNGSCRDLSREQMSIAAARS